MLAPSRRSAACRCRRGCKRPRSRYRPTAFARSLSVASTLSTASVGVAPQPTTRPCALSPRVTYHGPGSWNTLEMSSSGADRLGKDCTTILAEEPDSRSTGPYAPANLKVDCLPLFAS